MNIAFPYTFQAKKIWTLFFLLHTKSSLEVQGRNHEKTSAMVNQFPCGYSNVPNKRAYTLIKIFLTIPTS